MRCTKAQAPKYCTDNSHIKNLDLSFKVSPHNLKSKSIDRADLTDAYLRGADLTDAYLWNADLTGANLWYKNNDK